VIPTDSIVCQSAPSQPKHDTTHKWTSDRTIQDIHFVVRESRFRNNPHTQGYQQHDDDRKADGSNGLSKSAWHTNGKQRAAYLGNSKSCTETKQFYDGEPRYPASPDLMQGIGR
jgi:hypothetical protein